jgi:hypothetical protein
VAGAYAGVLIVWPFVSFRFVSPFNGLFFTVVAAGLVALQTRLPQRVFRMVALGMGLLFTLGAWQGGGELLISRMRCERSAPLESPTCHSEEGRGLLQLARYVRENSDSTDILFTSKEAAFYVHTGRRSVRDNVVNKLPAEALGARLRQRGVRYAVISPIGGQPRAHNRAIARACRDFDYVQSYEGDNVLLLLRPDGPIAEEGDLCRQLAALIRRPMTE